MQEVDRRRLVDAFAFALAVHGDQKRKGKQIPYASHLLAVAGLVLAPIALIVGAAVWARGWRSLPVHSGAPEPA